MITFSDQQAFLQIVKPPAGYKLTSCIGTTFSLDLECVVATARVTSKNGLSDETSGPNIYEALQGIAEFTQKTLIFFQNCQIKALERQQGFLFAKGYGRLISLLDQVVVPVSAPDIKSSFHPKVWLVKFDVDHGGGESIYRLLVASRNLSKQMDWEVGCILEGRREKRPNEMSRQLRGFFKSLQAKVPESKSSFYKEVLKDLQTLSFQNPPKTKSVQFLYKDSQTQNVHWIVPNDYTGLIIVSPFISTSMVSSLSGGIRDPNRFYLVTSPATAFKIQGLISIHKHCYTFSPGEVNVEGVGDVSMGLHAKIYLGLRADGAGTDVFLGSANCTTNGLGGPNTEAMMRLMCPISSFRDFLGNFIFQDIKNELLHNWLRQFMSLTDQELQLAKDAAAQEKMLEDARAALAAGQFRLQVQSGGKKARLRFLRPRSFLLARGVRVRVAPWNCQNSKGIEICLRPNGAIFSSKTGFDSDFLHVEVSYKDLKHDFMTVACSNINKRMRNQYVIGTYLRAPSAFFKYLRLILKMPPQNGNRGTTDGEGASGKKKPPISKFIDNSFLEEVLVNASHNKVVINQIQEALDATGRKDKALHEFSLFWSRFKEVHDEIVKDE